MRLTRALLVCCLALGAAAACFAQGTFRLVFTNAEITAVLRAVSMRTGASIVYAGKEDVKVSISVTASSTSDALRAVSSAAGMIFRQANTTFIVAPGDSMRQALEPYGERLRLTLNSTPPEDAAKVIQDTLPYLTVRTSIGQVLAIGTRDDLLQARTIVQELEEKNSTRSMDRQIYSMRYGSSKQAAVVVKSMYPDLQVESMGAEDKAGGSVAMSGSKLSIDAALELLGAIDIPQQPDSEFEFYQVKYASAPSLKTFLEAAAPGIKAVVGPESYLPTKPGFNTISGATIGGGSVSGGLGGLGGGGGAQNQQGQAGGAMAAEKPEDGARAKMLVLTGTRDQLNMAVRLLGQLDVPPLQINVEVRVIDASPEVIEDIGVKWEWNNFPFFEERNNTAVTTHRGNTRAPGFGAFSRLPWDATAFLDALVVSREAKLLASPNVSVIDGDDANIFIGETFRTKVATASGLGTQTQQIVEFPIGIALLIRPRVNSDGDVTLRIHPGVSTVTGFNSDGLPQTSTREAETTVMLKDGETVMIGGLIREEMTKTISEIPILSKLPLIGELFRHRSSSNRKSEVMVFITPRIVKATAGGR